MTKVWDNYLEDMRKSASLDDVQPINDMKMDQVCPHCGLRPEQGPQPDTVTEAMVQAAQGAYEIDHSYGGSGGLSNKDMRAALTAALAVRGK